MKNKIELKKCLIASMLTILIFEVCFGVIFSIQYKKYTQNTNIAINGIVEEVVKEYPKADKNEIVKILNGEKTNQNNLLKEYGIDIEKDSVIYENEKIYQKFMCINLAFLMISLLTIVIIFIIYNQRKDKKIKEITKYIEEINRKNYSLKIQNNTEDELSILQNELYKITIMLKEQAENSINDKMILILGFNQTIHNRKYVLPDFVFDENDYQNMIRVILDASHLDMNLERQRNVAMTQNVQDYKNV